MLISVRPEEIRCRVAVIWAARVGRMKPGRNATMYLRRSVSIARAALMSHASSHCEPVGVNTPSNPSLSAAWAICRR